ncbi:MAG: carboxymuconolactone decarboxylase family protein [Rhodobacteraceae bacterium]|nr:carboxymuconolactone decarboxylase family protein [Paracoccaceae bacterium]
MESKDLFDKGLTLRREVAGADLVDRAFANADDFSLAMEELVTEFCWGGIWARPGLDRRSRSILNIGMLVAANKPEQLAGHLKAGITNGLTKDEIKEILLQAAIYLGMPAGLSSFKIARQVFDEMGI